MPNPGIPLLGTGVTKLFLGRRPYKSGPNQEGGGGLTPHLDHDVMTLMVRHKRPRCYL